ncbi:hypothetical protein P7K49_036855 [Saguinus oedipus]|uniref:WAP domain-containing protein n=1 Tax=Saguinus oedipus TaxID=9490 RepID=A0ABQ9TM09_SAGOE|nr:hypothetical protein P7K49_036855 [Saguinus oedipus]
MVYLADLKEQAFGRGRSLGKGLEVTVPTVIKAASVVFVWFCSQRPGTLSRVHSSGWRQDSNAGSTGADAALSPQAEEAGVPGGPRQPRADRCPPPPRTLPPGACQAARCQADSECPRHRRCCYNGCAYACLEAVPPPPGGWARGTDR